jgi:hypothetical protein
MPQPEDLLTPEQLKFEEWKTKPIDSKLEDWKQSTQSLFNHDCGITALTAATFFTSVSGVFGIILAGGVAATLGSRARVSTEQHNKLAHLYTLYKSDVENESARINARNQTNTSVASSAFSFISNTVTSTVSTTVNAIGTKAGILSAQSIEVESAPENQGLQILAAIGHHLHPEQVTIWKCNPELIPQPYKEEMSKLGIYHASDLIPIPNSEKMECKLGIYQGNNLIPIHPDREKAGYNFKSEFGTDYKFLPNNPNLEARTQDRFRLGFYGYGNYVNKVLTPIGKLTGMVVDGACNFAKQNAADAMPAITSAANTAREKMKK